MAAQFYKINYKSDFVLTINSDAGWAVPFCIKFWTGMPSQAYFVGFDGEKYVNCRVGDTPTQLLVMFDDHHMPIGEMKMQIAYHTTIEEFPDRKFDEVTNPTNVTVDIDGTEYQVMLDFTGESGAEIDFSMPSSGVMSVNGKIGYVTLNAEDVGAQPTIEDLDAIRSGAAEGATAVQSDEMTAALATKQDIISDLSEIRRGAALGSTAVRPSELQQGLAGKQDTISDLAEIRSGAAAGATAVQPATLQEGLATKQDVINDLSTIRSGAAAGATAVQPAGLTPIQTALQTIEAVIPSAASSQNQLADKNFVNSSIATNTANFVGTFNSLAELQAVQNPTNNDYGFVIETDAQGNEYYDRYKYVASSQQWLFEYKVESTPFTAAQWAAIQSGITSSLVTKLNALPTNSELQQTLDGKADTTDIPTSLSQLSQDSTHRVVTDAEKSTWNGKQNAIDDLSTIRSGAAAGATAVQPSAMNTALAAKQDTLTFDNTPTANSSNPVKSSGIKTALDAKQSTISTVNVTVDNNTGTPSGSASVSGSTLSLSFQNLKGATGATGATGPQGPQGERGLPGESGVTGDVSGFTVIQTIDPSATYGATDIAGAATVQATNQELTELAGEVNNVLQKTVAFPTYEKGKISNTGTFTSDASYGTVRPIKLYDGDTIMLNLGSPLYHGYKIATLFRCDSTGTFIETLITGSGTSPESWTNTTGDTIYVGISGYKSQLGYIISKDIKSSFELLDEEIGDNINYSFDVAAGSSTPTTEKMEVDIAAGDIFYLKVSDTTGDGNAYELYFQYDGQSSGTKIGSVLSGTAYMYTASQKIDKIYLWKKAVSTNKTVRIDVWTGLLGQINLTESDLSTLKIATVKQAILSEAYTVASVTRNTSGNVTAASIVYPDGVTGTMTVTRNSAGAATSAVYTYGTSTYTLTITRDSNNNVTATSLS